MSNQYRIQNPVTNEIVASYDSATDAEIQSAIDAATRAYTSWSSFPMEKRSAIMHKVAALFDKRKEELAGIAAEEMGKPLSEGVEEVEFAAQIIDYYATNGPEFSSEQTIPTSDGAIAKLRRLPIGPLLGVMPWNFPYYQIARFVGPNLVLGNTVLLKDAEICPRSALAVQEIMDHAGVPAGVYTNIFANHDQVATIIADPRVQGVSLTGSERAGAIIGALAGQHLKKSVLELGGSDPYIVLDSDNVADAAKTAFQTRMYNTGQACNSNKRLIIMDDIYDAFIEQLINLAGEMKPGTPAEADGLTTYSPLSSREAAENLRQQLDRAESAGATIHVGGELADSGAYLSPAVVTGIPQGSDVYYKEFFGPVIVAYKVSSDKEAIELANDSQFGLGGAVFSSDEDRARAVAERLHVGMTNVNTPAGEGAGLPFGGVKRSGFGRELGPLGMDEFVNKQLYYIQR
ncbi:NAD-dependent succinate-semialdehyde dehydrogenase [Corynebacterium cystitidis]|uniref:Succinate-semialdehyde dehydrogenase / glutarate-semialdehyde dehydrogenase n=1 Tax=Corynebacterium cystitidis DSM 20524 TaxID=1121357 RepID=A0A1H9QPH1_9CORY|nr:NAD-dependent succinate-semialdehyde dehydrogenase [Corynebacterium cystitidis]WJY81706.1 Succinate semialdehyde dehydrogenase [NAD(P)+] Sad [Corynebacterium cystitidis DSM 20524]SER62344.1 succinate-semialdehyde dehydrogenase / glutarate-semialdehyde dehydrogenase [Corynebacterium cystitidis DSM 20524]SNV84674.1 putaitve succinate-semialdehyde dehydrogenase [Corynebacterium cystitidis]